MPVSVQDDPVPLSRIIGPRNQPVCLIVMEKDRVGMCVIGLGVGMEHARAYSKMDGVELYICDTDEARIARARSELAVAGAFTSIDSALSAGEVDAVDVNLPNSMHAPTAIQAARRMKHCMIEKPLATTLSEADSMIREAKDRGTMLATAENFQFSPFINKAAELIRSGRIGRVFLVSVLDQMWPIRAWPTSWWSRRDIAGGGVLICAGVHAVRTLRMLGTSEIASVYAIGCNISLGIESEDTCLLSAEFEDGALGSIPASWATPRSSNIFEVYGSMGSIIHKREGGLTILADSRVSDESENVVVPEVDTYDEECRAFVSSIRLGSLDDRISAGLGRKDLEIVEAAYRSISERQVIKLPL
ncbi:MAG: Gfo/Idh/MocA family oxidoreductase [Thaumarchaeota archaeon]|nr:Gfo/Idh/MocA family oxidoreductase [Nitrososphaerota archaeon]